MNIRIRKLRDCNQRGFGLLEVVIATAILGIVGGSFAMAMSTGIIGADKVSKSRTAMDLARSQVEYIKTLDFDDVVNTYNTGLDDDEDTVEEADITDHSPDAGYDIDVEIDDMPADPDLLGITVTVTYRDNDTVVSESRMSNR